MSKSRSVLRREAAQRGNSPPEWTKAPTTTRARTERPEDNVVCVDLFCGAGGLTHGLISAGVKVRAGVDFEEACRHPYEANHEGVAFHQADVAELEASTVAKWFGDAKVRVLAGCAPCQPFSTYALRYQKDEKVEDDQRWSLLNHFGRLVRELLPDIVTTENVPTVTRHSVFENFKNTLESLGYKVWVDVIDCAEYGLPQRRNRTVLLASLHGDIKLREPVASEARTVEDVIKEMPVLRHGGTDKSDRLHAASRLSDLNYERIQHSKPGGTWRDWPKHLVAKCHTKSTGKKYPAVYGRMKYDEPAPTLTTQFYGFGNGRFGHPTQARGLSLREGALLQGFPKDYSFIPEDQPIQFKALGRMIGNAVPVDLGRVIGQSIIEHVKQSFATSGAWLELLAAAVDVGSRPRRAIVSRRHSNRFADSYADPLAWRGTPPYNIDVSGAQCSGETRGPTMFASQLTQTIAHDLYTAGNNAGKGYAVGDDEDTVSDAAHNLGEIIIRPGSTSEVYVVRAYEDDRIVAIGGDGMGCGPWAVDLDLDSVEA